MPKGAEALGEVALGEAPLDHVGPGQETGKHKGRSFPLLPSPRARWRGARSKPSSARTKHPHHPHPRRRLEARDHPALPPPRTVAPH